MYNKACNSAGVGSTVRGSNFGGGGEIFHTYPDRPWGSPSLLYNGCPVFPGSKERPGRDADPSPLPVPWSRKGKASCTSTPRMGGTDCTEPQCLYKGALYFLHNSECEIFIINTNNTRLGYKIYFYIYPTYFAVICAKLSP